MSFKSWFKRRLGIHLVDGVEVVDLGNVDPERIIEFARNEGSAVLEGNYLSKDGRDVFEANSGQQFLINDDGSMISLGIHAGERVVIVKGGHHRWQTLPENFEAICEETTRQLVGFEAVYPGFVCLAKNNMIRFDKIDAEESQLFQPEFMELLDEDVQSVIKDGLFVFCHLLVGKDDSNLIQIHSFPVD